MGWSRFGGTLRKDMHMKMYAFYYIWGKNHALGEVA